MKPLKIVGAAVAAVIVVVALLLAVGIPQGFLTSQIRERVEQISGYKMTSAGATKIGIWPTLNVTLNDVTLQDPNEHDTSRRLTAGRVQADMTLAGVWAGHPHITELVIADPVITIPLLRERVAAPHPSLKSAAASSGAADANTLTIDRIRITGGTMVFSNLRDRVESRIEGIDADANINADGKVDVAGSARAGAHPLKFAIVATAPAWPAGRQNIPVALTLEAADLLPAPLSAKAEVRLNGPVVTVNGVSGTIGGGAFNGWAFVDLASKPLVKLDLDFQRLDIAIPKAGAAPAAQDSQSSNSQASNSQASNLKPWSNVTIGLNGLNYVDAQMRISAAELNIGDAHFAPAAIDVALAGGAMKCAFSNLGVYGGFANGEVTVDAATGTPGLALRSDLTGVGALPLLRDVAGFDKLDGKLQAKIIVTSTGNSQRAILSNLGGTVSAVFQDGAIRGLNVAQMIRSLASSTLSGWQDAREQSTDLTQLAASFRIDKGQAVTTDLNLVGPLVKMTGAGTVDLGTQMLAFRVEPKLVMTTEGQGRASDPVGLGIPVIIDGPWAEPRIYPEMAGILDDPDAAYAKLKEIGKGLFGGSGAGGNGSGALGGGGLSDQLGSTLGKLLQQGFGQGRSMPPPASATPQPQPSDPNAQAPDSPPMNDILRQLFNR